MFTACNSWYFLPKPLPINSVSGVKSSKDALSYKEIEKAKQKEQQMMRIDKQAQSVGAVSNGQGHGGGDAEIYTLWPQSVSLLTSNLAYK